jgi:DNA-binding CsgD family transcriptional regulator
VAKDLAFKEEFIRLRAEGKSFSKIADQLEVSRPTLIKWSGELQSQISAARYAQLEALAEEYGLLKEARVKAFGQLLEKLTTELSKRELAEVPTFQLLKMILDVSSRVRGEFSSVTHSEGGMADLNLFCPATLRID